ncbi:PPPDE putative peptidase domain-containing protein [Cokeromyces recurvatus]|uniref:PPPDE putative peptidase domain-containing protein n=1 Tax=Cokeromyces recurvatus TaxID=90255 RepID=UPI002220BD0F|nr:PPPDE putative peptidase domain-containing protein [Cokeromyces recurvatus]KAI7898374.1 PPPDE putative peptidase domain-containing protein [Cokeromyces recurvatus]
MSAEPVQLYVYDLSQGMARSMSLQLTGKQIDGIWHTSVVVYGQEFYFGQGIMTSIPGTTQHGRPLEIIDIGETYLPLEMVIDYIYSLRSVYTAEKYHLLDFNCNTFSNDLCQFLCGKTIPMHITSLPSEFVNTPFGQSILPMIENMFGQTKLKPSEAAATTTTSSSSLHPPSTDAASLLQGISSAATSAAPTTVNPVQLARSASEVDGFISSYKAVIVFFTSATCPPCRIIKPDFERLIVDKNNSGPSQQIKILGVILDLSMSSPDVMKYGVRATPTFHLYLNGTKYSEFQGANYAELKSQVDILLFEAYPPHPHRKILLKTITHQSNAPILFPTMEKLDIVYAKLNEFLEKRHIVLEPRQKDILDESKKYLEANGSIEFNVNEWKLLVDDLLSKLSIEEYFPLLDIYRTLLVSTSNFYVKDPSQIAKIMEIAYTHESTLNSATWLMILRIACNIFSNDSLSTTHFTSSLHSSHRTQLTQLLITSLLSSDAKVRRSAASLAYNCSTVIAIERLKKEEGTFTGMAEQEDDDWQVELSSAIMDAFTKETNEEKCVLSNFPFFFSSSSSSGCYWEILIFGTPKHIFCSRSFISFRYSK